LEQNGAQPSLALFDVALASKTREFVRSTNDASNAFLRRFLMVGSESATSKLALRASIGQLKLSVILKRYHPCGDPRSGVSRVGSCQSAEKNRTAYSLRAV
jgi:hypothetical protein